MVYVQAPSAWHVAARCRQKASSASYLAACWHGPVLEPQDPSNASSAHDLDTSVRVFAANMLDRLGQNTSVINEVVGSFVAHGTCFCCASLRHEHCCVPIGSEMLRIASFVLLSA